MNARSTADGKSVDFMLGQIHAQNASILQTLSEDRMASAQYRTEVRKELKEHSERMAEIEGSQKSMAVTLSDIEPKVDRLESNRYQVIGAMQLGRVMWGVLTGAAGAGVLAALQWVFGAHKP